ncbi:MAG: efflux RND transporter periplasmic adaptor subunit [Candidatus Rokubacteria bacterium]|nr:efflux RND transporter periplasmic adaptor subunit [Candidatus Rokubacteria bacterium]
MSDATTPLPAPRRRRWRRIAVGGGILGLLLAMAALGIQLFGALLQERPTLSRAIGKSLRVTAAQVTEEEIGEVIGGTSVGQSLISIAINTAIGEGRVLVVKVDVGDLVRAGQALLEFDTAVFRETLEKSRLQVESAKVELEKLLAVQKTRALELKEGVVAAREKLSSARTSEETNANTYQRTTILYERKVVALAELEATRVKWEDARSALATAISDLLKAENALANDPAVAKAELEAAQYTLALATQTYAQAAKDLENTVVRAPRTGIIASRTADPGEALKSGNPLFVLDLIDTIYAAADIEQEKRPYVSLDQDAEVVFDSYPTRTFRGKIAKIDANIDPTKRTFKTYVLLQNPSLELRTGMAAFTRINRTRRVTLVPRLAVINATGSPAIDATVFVVENSAATLRKVKLGKAEGPGKMEVLDGLKPGEWVVIHGQLEINPGDRVLVERHDASQTRKTK